MLPQVAKTRLRRFFEPRLPPVAGELSPRAIALVKLDPKNARLLERFAVTPLPAGLVVPSLVEPNIVSMQELLSIVKASLAKAEIKSQRISVAIPDASARVAIHHLDMLSGNENEKQQLLRWRLKKTVPFNIEEAHLSYLEHKGANGKYTVLTVCIHKQVLAQYEDVFQKLGIHAGYISLSSFAAFELLTRIEADVWQGSVLFVRLRPSGVSSLIHHQGSIVFFRHLDHETGEASAGGADGEIERDLYSELHPCVMYHQDKLSAHPLDKIYVSCPQDPSPTLLASLSERFRTPVLSLDPMRFFQSTAEGQLRSFKSLLMPPLGLALGRF
jgi:type IV pilus assembly protein PilM